jgi:hypothetical protein
LALDELAGLTQLDFGVRPNTPGQGRPSFRNMAAFMFQPQNIVANPDVFFFKADTYDHREKLISIFPYVLGAITPALLAKQYEVDRLKRDLTRKQRELASIRTVSERWTAEIDSKVATARELGLLRLDQPVPAGLPGRVEALKRIAMAVSVLPQPSAEGSGQVSINMQAVMISLHSSLLSFPEPLELRQRDVELCLKVRNALKLDHRLGA